MNGRTACFAQRKKKLRRKVVIELARARCIRYGSFARGLSIIIDKSQSKRREASDECVYLCAVQGTTERRGASFTPVYCSNREFPTSKSSNRIRAQNNFIYTHARVDVSASLEPTICQVVVHERSIKM